MTKEAFVDIAITTGHKLIKDSDKDLKEYNSLLLGRYAMLLEDVIFGGDDSEDKKK